MSGSAMQAPSAPSIAIPVATWSPRGLLYLGVMSALVCAHLLLPIERGFPGFRMVGIPFTLPILVGIGAILLLIVESGGDVLRPVRVAYPLGQTAVVIAFLISTIVSPDPQAAGFVLLNYLVVFLLDYLVVQYLLRRGARPLITGVICTGAGLAAFLGILEGLFRYHLPIYAHWLLAQDYNRMRFELQHGIRSLGTLGNPILYSVMLALTLPFAADLKRRWLRYVLVALIVWASLYAVSLTGAVIVAIVLTGAAWRTRHRAAVLLGGLVIFPLLFAGVIATSPLYRPVMALWSSKVSLRNVNALTRVSMVSWAEQRFANASLLNVVVGAGLKTSADAAAQISSAKHAVDNAYATVLLDSGLVGMGCYMLALSLAIFPAPRGRKVGLQWYAVVGLAAAGLSFDTVSYATINLLWTVSVAIVESERGGAEKAMDFTNQGGKLG